MSGNPTVKELAESMADVDKRTLALVSAVESMQRANSQDFAKIWTTLRGVTRTTSLAQGLSDVLDALAPLGLIAPPTTATGLDPGVDQALATIREALGQRPADVGELNTPFDAAVGFIGAP